MRTSLLLGVCMLLATSVASHNKQQKFLDIAATSNAHFTKNFFREVYIAANKDNVVCSPASAQLTLGLIRLAAKGQTKEQLSSALKIESHVEEGESFKQLLELIKSIKGQGRVIHVFNRVFVRNDLKLRKEFQDAAKSSFGSKAKRINFSSAEAVKTINDIVSKETRSKIKDLIEPNSFDSNTASVIVNTLYFQGAWKKAFKVIPSYPFYDTENIAQHTKFLNTKGNYHTKHISQLRAQAIDIPYEGQSVSFIILLPDRDSSLMELEHALSSEDITKISLLLDSEEINSDLELYIPKFKFETSLDLKEPLQNMGITKMFDPESADLSGLTASREKLFVSKVVQKTVIDVSEKGTEAASATYARIQSRMYVERNEFKANRPFLFYIILRHDDQRYVLFSGRFVSVK